MKALFEQIKVFAKTGFFHIFGSSVINKIVGFLSSIVLVHILSKTEYGIFTYAWNIYSIVLLFNGMGMEYGVLQMCSELTQKPVYSQKICSYGAKYGIVFDIILAIILLGIALIIPLKVDGANELLIMLALLPVAQLLFNLSVAVLRSQRRNQEFSGLMVFNTIMVFLCTACGAFFFREKGMVLGYYIAYTVSLLLIFNRFQIRLFPPNGRPEQRDKKALRSIAFVSMCNNGLSQLMYLLDVFVLGLVDPRETVLASYKVATIIPSALTFIPLALITYLYPYFAEHCNDRQWCMRKYKQILLGMGSVNMLIAAMLVVSAPMVIRLLFGVEYMDGVSVFRILALNYFFSGTFRILSGNLLVTQRRLKFNLLVALISGITNIAADILFIHWWGSTGAALATVLVTLISGVLSTTYLIHIFRNSRGMANGI